MAVNVYQSAPSSPPPSGGYSSPNASSGGRVRPSGGSSHGNWSPVVVLVIVFGAVVVSQAIVLGVLGAESTKTGTNTSCAFGFLGFCLFSTSSSSPDPSAVNAQNTATAITPWFVLLDVLLLVGVVYAIVRARSGPGRGSGRQIGSGSRGAHRRRR